MSTPRTDAEHAKTLTPAYEYVGAETEAWEWARKLEKELIEIGRYKSPRVQRLAGILAKSPRPFSALF